MNSKYTSTIGIVITAVALIVGTMLSSTALASPSDKSKRVLVLKSDEGEPYDQAIAGFKEQLTSSIQNVLFVDVSLQGDPARLLAAISSAKKHNPELIFPVGALAMQGVSRELPTSAIVGTLYLTHSEIQASDLASGVELELTGGSEIAWLKKILPNRKKVGVIASQGSGMQHAMRLQQQALSQGISFVVKKIGSPEEIPDALQSLVDEVEVLFGVADPIVMNSKTAQQILLYSYRNKIPLVGLSTKWTKAGAIYSLDRDYADMGRQSGEIAAKMLNGSLSTPTKTSPRIALYSLNLRTARHMKIELPEALIKQAAEVFE